MKNINYHIEISGNDGFFRQDSRVTLHWDHITKQSLTETMRKIKSLVVNQLKNDSVMITVGVSDSSFNIQYSKRWCMTRFDSELTTRKHNGQDFSEITGTESFTDNREMARIFVQMLEIDIRKNMDDIPKTVGKYAQSLQSV